MLKNLMSYFFVLSSVILPAQNISDSLMLSSIYKTSLLNGKAYDWLDHMTNQIGGRLSGSLNAERSVQWAKEELEGLELDKVWLQPVLVPKWVRGPKEFALIETEPGVTFQCANHCTWRFSCHSICRIESTRLMEVQKL